jgi:protein O-mannosyl-transferase
MAVASKSSKRGASKPLPLKQTVQGRQHSVNQSGIAVMLLVAATFLAYWPVLRCDFAGYDDSVYVTDNWRVLQGLTWAGVDWAFANLTAGFWHPLTWLSLMLDVTVFGQGPMGFHLTNLLLHTGSTLVLFLCLRHLTGAVWRSAMVAALFALHPLHVEAVAFIAERKEVLSAFFGVLTLFMYSRYAQAGGQDAKLKILNYSLALLFFTCGLMSKTMVVTVPVVMLLLDYWPLQRLTFRSPWPALIRVMGEKAPFFVLSLAAGLLTLHAEKSIGAVSHTEQIPLAMRMSNAVFSVGAYLGQMIWPVNLSVFYPYPQSLPLLSVTLAALLLGAISVMAVWWGRRRPYFLMGWLWFVVMLAPVSGLIQVGVHSRADRYTYLPLIGVFVVLVWGANELGSRWRVSRNLMVLAAALALAACTLRTRDQLRHWQDAGALFRHALSVTGSNYVAANNLGYYLMSSEKRFDEAIPYFRESIRLSPTSVSAYNNLGFALAAKGQTSTAIAAYQSALQLDPQQASAHNNLGNALSDLGKIDEAVKEYQLALQIQPDHAEAHNNLGIVFAQRGQLDEAMEHFRAALLYKPNNPIALNSLGNVFVLRQQFAEAIPEYTAALRLKPDYMEAHNGLGYALANTGHLTEALAEFQEALRLSPDYPPAHFNLGCALDRLGHRDEGVAHIKEALRLKPDYPEAKEQLRSLGVAP